MEQDEARKLKRIQDEIHEAMKPFIAAKLSIIDRAIPHITVREGQPPVYWYSKAVQSDLDYVDRHAKETRDYILKREGIVLPDEVDPAAIR